MRSKFWLVCGVWMLVLTLVALVRSYSTVVDDRDGGMRPRRSMPSIGQTVSLPPKLVSTRGETIRTLDVGRSTLFLVTWAGCLVCKREMHSYPQLTRVAEEMGLAVRVLVLPGTPAEDRWFLDRWPDSNEVVLDTAGISTDGLGVGITPSVVIVTPAAVVESRFWPSQEWPVTAEILSVIPSLGGPLSREHQPRE